MYYDIILPGKCCFQRSPEGIPTFRVTLKRMKEKVKKKQFTDTIPQMKMVIKRIKCLMILLMKLILFYILYFK